MQQLGFWSRVGGWFHRSSRANGGVSHAPPVESAAASAPDHAVLNPEDATVPAGPHRVTRREHGLSRAQDGYNRIISLVESVQEHLRHQDERTEVVARSLESLANSLSRTPETAQAQMDALARIGAQIEEQGARARKLEDNFSQLPRIADAQRETMASIGRQLAVVTETTSQVNTTLETFQRAVMALNEASTTTLAVLRELHTESAAREERLARLLREQTQRFTWFAVTALSVSMVAVVLGIVAILK